MPRRIKPPASPALSLLRAKAARERIKLAQERRQEAKDLALARRVKARAAREAREEAAYRAVRLVQERTAARAASAERGTPTRALSNDRLEARDAERWRALGIDRRRPGRAFGRLSTRGLSPRLVGVLPCPRSRRTTGRTGRHGPPAGRRRIGAEG